MAEEIIRTTCGYCSIGCALDIQMLDGKAIKVLPAKDYPVNKGKTCTKGFNLIKALESNDRALSPLLRDRTTGQTKAIGWDEAAKTFTNKFKEIQKKYGPESVAFISTGQIPFEEMALLGAVGKFGMGIRHGDGNTRQCMASAVVAYKQAFGFDAPPFTYKDVEESDLLIFMGANPAIAHPILWQRARSSPKNPTIVVIDPRLTDTAKEASIHLPIEPKSDLTLMYTLANIFVSKNWTDSAFINQSVAGFEEYKTHIAPFSIERCAKETGLSEKQIMDFAELIHQKKSVSIWWTMGVNQSHQGVRTAQSIINFCLLTGNVGRPGTGPNSITGQCNAMGSRLFSNTSGLLGGHDFANQAHRTKVSGILGIPDSMIPPDAGKNYDQILEAVEAGTIKGLWFICTNPAHSWIDKNTFLKRLESLDFLVVQDLYTTTETAMVADLLLPAAGSAEKSGTFINSERRLGIVQKVKDPPGEAKSDFDIFKLLAEAWGVGDYFKAWKDPAAAFDILKTLSKGQPCDISGVKKWSDLAQDGGVQWPYPEGGQKGDNERRLFEDGKFFTPDQKAKLLFTDVIPLPEVPDAQYPFFLLTGRGTMHQWHTQTRTGKVESIKKMYPQESYAEINPVDAQKLGIVDGEKVEIKSRRGAVRVNAMVKDSVREGFVFLPMHYPDANFLTFPVFDPYSRQPSYKFGAVQVTRG